MIFVVIFAGCVFYVNISMHYAKANWYNGLGNSKLISEWPECTIVPPGIPWPSMLPHRTLNFFSKF